MACGGGSEKSAGTTPPVVTDAVAPSVPTNLSADSVTADSLTLTWSPSTDNVGVTGYRVYRGGALQSTVATPTYGATGLAASTTYSFSVAAVDAAGNASAQCAPLSVATRAVGQRPTISAFPASPAAIASGQNSTLAWTVVGATSLSIDQGVGTVTGSSQVVVPAVTTTYTLTAGNGAGTTTARATVTVNSGVDPWSDAGKTVVDVCSVAELTAALTQANTRGNTTLYLCDGTYTLNDQLRIRGENITLRSRSGNRNAVILRGHGANNGDVGFVLSVEADHCRVRDLGIGEVYYHGVQVHGETNIGQFHALNVRFYDIREQMIKVSSNADPDVFSQGGIVEGCLFEYTAGQAYQYYCGGIDGHHCRDWIIRNNEFRNIRISDDLTEGAVHFWNRSMGNLVEGNRIVNCDRGIMFGMQPNVHHEGGIIRNNFIHVVEDAGIYVEGHGVEILHNTIWLDSDYPNAIEYRFATTTELVIANNLSNGQVRARDGASGTLSRNVATARVGWFVNPATGNLHLASAVTDAVNAGDPLHSTAVDIDGQTRTGNPDIGADEWSGALAPTPVISGFSATPSTISAGGASTLSWAVTGATSLTLDPGIGAVTGSSLAVNPGATVTYTLTARNDAGSTTATTILTVQTVPDTQAPTVPSQLTVANVTSSSLRLSWNPSTDNVGVAGYRVFLDGELRDTVATTALNLTGLSANTHYRLAVSAFDAAGNVSVRSAEIDATTAVTGSSVHAIRRGFAAPITAAIKANLRAIKLRGDALGRQEGILGQWGDSITYSNAYLGALGSWNLVAVPPEDGHDYVPILLWMGASRLSDDNPLHNFKGDRYCNESGWQVTNALGAISGAIARSNPSWSLTMYGTNDIRQAEWAPAEYEQRLERFLQVNIDEGIVPVVSTIPPCVGWDARVAAANVIIRRVAANLNLPVVDLHDLFTTLHPSDWATVLLGDGVHPSYSGRSGDLSEDAQRNDGYNLRTMLTVDMAEKIKRIVFDNGAPEGADLPILVVRSATHPYKTLTRSLTPTFEFLHDSGPVPTGYSWTVDQSPHTLPDTTAEGSTSSASPILAHEGTWYLHVRANSAAGWGPAAHYCLRATSVPTVELRYRGESVSPHQDTSVYLGSSGTNYGSAATLNIYNADAGNQSMALLRFDVSSAPATGLVSATITLNLDLPIAEAVDYQVFNVTSSWEESAVTWSSRPTLGSGSLGSGTISVGQSQIEIDVTALAQGWLSGSMANHGIGLQHLSRYHSLLLIAREYGLQELRPTLRLRYALGSGSSLRCRVR